MKEMSKAHLNNVLRWIKKARYESIVQLRQKAYHTRNRLGVKRDMQRAAKKMKRGSDQMDLRLVVVWMDSITVEDKEAISQLVAIDATATSQIQGRYLL